jgi:hypothetical protein
MSDNEELVRSDPARENMEDEETSEEQDPFDAELPECGRSHSRADGASGILVSARRGWSWFQRCRSQRKSSRALREALLGRLRYPTFAVHLTNANIFAAPGGLERYILESSRYALEHEELSSLIVFPSRDISGGLHILADHQLMPAVEQGVFLRFLYEQRKAIGSLHLQHSMNWNLGRLHELLVFAEEHVPRRLLYVHDYQLICTQHNLLWNDQKFCGPPENIETGLCSNCMYGTTVRSHRAGWEVLLDQVPEIVLPSQAAKNIFQRAFPHSAEKIHVVPHLNVGERPVSEGMRTDIKPAIVFSGAAGFNKGIDRYAALIERHGERYRWVTVGIEDYFHGHPLVEHRHYSFHGAVPLDELLNTLKPAVAFLGSLVPETFSYTTHEMLAAGLPILSTVESGNIADTVRLREAGKVYASFDEMSAALGDKEEIPALLKNARRYEVSLNTQGLRWLYRRAES